MRQGNPWTVSKGFDTFCPLSEMKPASQVQVNPNDARLWLKVNGEIKQDSRTSDMIWNCEELVSRISRFMTLDHGDVIATGTPQGVGPFKDGDVCEAGVEGIGELKLHVRAEHNK